MMENNIAIIKNDEDRTLNITIKDAGMTERDVFSTIVTIMEWTAARHHINPQKVMDAIKSKNFFNELVYNPPEI